MVTPHGDEFLDRAIDAIDVDIVSCLFALRGDSSNVTQPAEDTRPEAAATAPENHPYRSANPRDRNAEAAREATAEKRRHLQQAAAAQPAGAPGGRVGEQPDPIASSAIVPVVAPRRILSTIVEGCCTPFRSSPPADRHAGRNADAARCDSQPGQ